MPISYHHPADVLAFAAAQDGAYALVVVLDVTGGAMRAAGALMCVTAAGETAGYISNGCVDADIIFQAQQALESGETLRLRYGEGSPFKDITLPCGGRIDVLIMPEPPFESIVQAASDLGQRRSVILSIAGETMTYSPKLRVRLAGRGEAVRALVQQALMTGFDVLVQSPDDDMAEGFAVEFQHLKDPKQPVRHADDPWTAVVLLFHDHDWEPNILAEALAGPAFYVGAMGSTRTHALRKQNLLDLGVEGSDIQRICGPIGLISSMRDANLLALSVLAEIVSTAQEAGRL